MLDSVTKFYFIAVLIAAAALGLEFHLQTANLIESAIGLGAFAVSTVAAVLLTVSFCREI